MSLATDVASKLWDVLQSPRLLIFQKQLDWLYRVMYPYIMRDFVHQGDFVEFGAQVVTAITTHVHAVETAPGASAPSGFVIEPPILGPKSAVLLMMSEVALGVTGMVPYPYPIRQPIIPPVQLPIPGISLFPSDDIQPFSI